MLKDSAIKYSAENTAEEQVDKLVQETTGGTTKWQRGKEAKRVLNERENIARKPPQKWKNKLTKVTTDILWSI